MQMFFYGEVGGEGHFTLQGKVFLGADRPPLDTLQWIQVSLI